MDSRIVMSVFLRNEVLFWADCEQENCAPWIVLEMAAPLAFGKKMLVLFFWQNGKSDGFYFLQEAAVWQKDDKWSLESSLTVSTCEITFDPKITLLQIHARSLFRGKIALQSLILAIIASFGRQGQTLRRLVSLTPFFQIKSGKWTRHFLPLHC